MSAQRPTITAIVVNYNGREFIGAALQSLRAQTAPPDQIIVVDNQSTDDSVELIRRDFPDVELMRSDTNLGFTGGNNLAAQHARGEYLALLNSDAAADPRWLEELSAVLASDPAAAASVGKIHPAQRPDTIEQAGALFNNVGNYWGRGFGEVDRGQYDKPCEVPGLTGCAMLIRRSALHGAPLFDESLFMYGEELDLTLRLRANGYAIRYTPRAVVLHEGMKSVASAGLSPRLFLQRLANRNRLKLIAKYYPASLLVRGLPFILAGLLYWDLVFLQQRGPRGLLEFLRDQLGAIRDGLRQRDRAVLAAYPRWKPWMTRQGLSAMIRQMRAMQRRAPTVKSM